MKFLTSLILLLYVGFFSGCNARDTVGSSDAEAAAEEKAALEERARIIEEAVAFLGSKIFEATLIDDGILPDSNYTRFHSYDEDTKELIVETLRYEVVKRGSQEEKTMKKSTVQKWKVAELNPVITIDVAKSNVNKLEYRKIVVKGKMIEAPSSDKHITSTKSHLEDEVYKNIKAENFKPCSESSFYVTGEDAPRIKAALGDLMKAHGVKPSKY